MKLSEAVKRQRRRGKLPQSQRNPGIILPRPAASTVKRRQDLTIFHVSLLSQASLVFARGEQYELVLAGYCYLNAGEIKSALTLLRPSQT